MCVVLAKIVDVAVMHLQSNNSNNNNNSSHRMCSFHLVWLRVCICPRASHIFSCSSCPFMRTPHQQLIQMIHRHKLLSLRCCRVEYLIRVHCTEDTTTTGTGGQDVAACLDPFKEDDFCSLNMAIIYDGSLHFGKCFQHIFPVCLPCNM